MSASYSISGLVDHIEPLTISDSTAGSALDVLGPPNKPFENGALRNPNSERYSLVQAYAGHTNYLAHTLSSLLGSSRNSWVTSVLPLRKRDDLNFAVTRYVDDSTLAAITAPNAPPEYVENGSYTLQFVMQRYSKGAEFDIESLKTQDGQFVAARKLANIATSFINTIEMNTIRAMTSQRLAVQARLRLNGERYVNVEGVTAAERALFGIVQKSHRGFYHSLEEVRKVMAPYTVTDVAVPEGFRSQIVAGPGEHEYYRAGPGARDALTNGANALARVGPDNITFHVARTLSAQAANAHISPLTSTKTIGSHERLTLFENECAPEQYCSAMLNARVFDLSDARGKFTLIRQLAALRNSERFELDGVRGALTAHHKALAARPDEWRARAGLPETRDHRAVDMFVYRSDHSNNMKVVQLLGQMEYDALSDEALHFSASTALHAARSQLASEDVHALLEGARIIELQYSRNGSGSAELPDVSVNAIGSDSVVKANEYGGPVLTDATIAGMGDNSIPLGLGSVPGLRTLAKYYNGQADSSIFAKAAKFNSAAERLYDIVSSLYPADHPSLNPINVPAYFRSSLTGEAGRRQNAITVLLQNHLDKNKLPLHRTAIEGQIITGATNINSFVDAIAPRNSDNADDERTALRQSLVRAMNYFTPLVRRTVADPAKLLRQFPASALARAWSDAMRGEGMRSSNTSNTVGGFVLAVLALESVDEPVSNQGVASLLDRTAYAVLNDEDTFDGATVRNTIRAWTRVDAPTDVDAMSSSFGTVITQLVLPNTVYNDLSAAVRTVYLRSSPFNVSQALSAALSSNALEAAEEDSRRDVGSAFVNSQAHGPAGPWARQGQAMRNLEYDGHREGGRTRSYESTFEPEAQASFAGRLFVNASSNDEGKLEVSGVLGERYSHAYRNTHDVLKRMFVQLHLLAPVCLATFERWIAHDIYVPIDVLVLRPWAHFDTQGYIAMSPGQGQMGEIAHGHEDVQVSSNATNKTIMVHASMWFTPVIKEPERYFLFEHAAVRGTRGGLGVAPYRAADFNSQDVATPAASEPHRDYSRMPSALYCAVPALSLANSERVPKMVDIRGRFDEHIVGARLTRGALQHEALRPHYASATFYFNHFNMDSLRPPEPHACEYYGGESGSHNTITYQGAQQVYSSVTRGYDKVIVNTGHLGPNIAEGMGDLMSSGLAGHFPLDVNQGKAQIFI